MNNNQYTYNQPPMGQMMPPPQMGMPRQAGAARPRGWRERWMNRFGMDMTVPMWKGERTIPNWLTGKSIIFFFVAMLACFAAFGYPMEMQYAFITTASVLLFFYGSKVGCQNWASTSQRTYIRNVFLIGLCVRLIWVIYCYFFFNPDYYGTTYGDGADVEWYMPFGRDIAEWVRGNRHYSFNDLLTRWNSAIDDVGYPMWLAIVNLLTFDTSDVFVPFLIKCLVSSYCAICIYHVAKRHFGEGTARISALFVALNPNMIYWCGTMFKEVEMVFLCCLCVDFVDKTFTSSTKLTFNGLMPGIFVGFAIFFFRASLAIIIFMSMFAHIVMASNRVMSLGKKVIAGVLVAVTLLIGMGDKIMSQAEKAISDVQSDKQQVNMEWRARREGGNNFAKYASAAVFAPLIFTIPFPTFNVALEEQILQRQLSGGSYIKNIFSFFVIWAMFVMLLSGEWRRHVFIIAYVNGYLVALVLSEFAQSGRFHMPIMPMLMLFAAYGIQIAKTNARVRKWFPVVLVVEVVACLAWNWFKLKGRGMI